jgi:hypothetical protein
MKQILGIPMSVVINSPVCLCINSIKINLHRTAVYGVHYKFLAPTGFFLGRQPYYIVNWRLGQSQCHSECGTEEPVHTLSRRVAS